MMIVTDDEINVIKPVFEQLIATQGPLIGVFIDFCRCSNVIEEPLIELVGRFCQVIIKILTGRSLT